METIMEGVFDLDIYIPEENPSRNSSFIIVVNNKPIAVMAFMEYAYLYACCILLASS